MSFGDQQRQQGYSGVQPNPLQYRPDALIIHLCQWQHLLHKQAGLPLSARGGFTKPIHPPHKGSCWWGELQFLECPSILTLLLSEGFEAQLLTKEMQPKSWSWGFRLVHVQVQRPSSHTVCVYVLVPEQGCSMCIRYVEEISEISSMWTFLSVRLGCPNSILHTKQENVLNQNTSKLLLCTDKILIL